MTALQRLPGCSRAQGGQKGFAAVGQEAAHWGFCLNIANSTACTHSRQAVGRKSPTAFASGSTPLRQQRPQPPRPPVRHARRSS